MCANSVPRPNGPTCKVIDKRILLSQTNVLPLYSCEHDISFAPKVRIASSWCFHGNISRMKYITLPTSHVICNTSRKRLFPPNKTTDYKEFCRMKECCFCREIGPEPRTIKKEGKIAFSFSFRGGGTACLVQGDTSPGEPRFSWLWFWLFHPLPGSAWADGKLAELAEQLGKMVEHPKSMSTQPRFARRCVTLYIVSYLDCYLAFMALHTLLGVPSFVIFGRSFLTCSTGRWAAAAATVQTNW